jgi:hypothetical protein
LNFQPKTEKELQEQMLWPDGEYDFEVVKAEPAKSGPQSKNPGTPFIKLNVAIFNADGAKKFINPILHPAMEWQLRQFCEETLIIEKYESGSLEAGDCEGLCGKLQLKTKEAEGNFPAKNEVKAWGVKKKAEKASTAAVAASKVSDAPPHEGDDVPFN